MEIEIGRGIPADGEKNPVPEGKLAPETAYDIPARGKRPEKECVGHYVENERITLPEGDRRSEHGGNRGDTAQFGTQSGHVRGTAARRGRCTRFFLINLAHEAPSPLLRRCRTGHRDERSVQ